MRRVASIFSATALFLDSLPATTTTTSTLTALKQIQKAKRLTAFATCCALVKESMRESEKESSRARCSYVMFLLVKLHNFQSLSVSLFLSPVLLRSLARVARVPPRRLATLQMQSLYLPLTLHLYLCVFDFVKRFIT